MNRYTPELVAKIERLRKGGCTWDQVARQCGYTNRQSACSAYYQARLRLGLPVGPRKRILPAEVLVARVAELRAQGKTFREIAVVLGYSSAHTLTAAYSSAVGVLARRGVR